MLVRKERFSAVQCGSIAVVPLHLHDQRSLPNRRTPRFSPLLLVDAIIGLVVEARATVSFILAGQPLRAAASTSQDLETVPSSFKTLYLSTEV